MPEATNFRLAKIANHTEIMAEAGGHEPWQPQQRIGDQRSKTPAIFRGWTPGKMMEQPAERLHVFVANFKADLRHGKIAGEQQTARLLESQAL